MIHLQNASYNLDLAKIFGVNSSIFLNCLDIEFHFLERNNKLDESNTILLSRAEIYERTALDDTQQTDVEITLQQCGVLLVKTVQNNSNKNYYILNYNQLEKVLESSDPKLVLPIDVANQFIKGKRKTPLSKRQAHINSLKKQINVEDPLIQQYLCDWIDAVYVNPKGFLSESGVTLSQEELMEYSKGNQDVQIAILKEAIKGGLRKIEWAIERYEKNHDINSRNFTSYETIKADKYNLSDEEF